jgi:YbbR domain-containing protein
MSKKTNYFLNVFEATNWKAITFFTSFTFVLWLILQFSKEHQIDYSLNIEFTDIPINEIVEKKSISLTSSLNETGFKIFQKEFTNKTITISLSKLEKYDDHYIFDVSLFASQIAEQLNVSSKNFNIENNRYRLPYAEKSIKKVAVNLNQKLEFSNAYASYSGVILSKDSIEIAGPKNAIRNIEAIESKQLSLTNLKKDEQGEIKLINPKPDLISIEKEYVDYTIQVEKFTEISLNLPIKLINSPDEYKVELIPQTVNLKFQTSIENADLFDEEDFLVVCDFNNAIENAYIIVPKIKKSPDKAIRLELDPKQIEYILRK